MDRPEKTTAICGENDDSFAADELEAMQQRAEAAETERDDLKARVRELEKAGEMLVYAIRTAPGLDTKNEQTAMENWCNLHNQSAAPGEGNENARTV